MEEGRDVIVVQVDRENDRSDKECELEELEKTKENSLSRKNKVESEREKKTWVYVCSKDDEDWEETSREENVYASTTERFLRSTLVSIAEFSRGSFARPQPMNFMASLVPHAATLGAASSATTSSHGSSSQTYSFRNCYEYVCLCSYKMDSMGMRK